MNGQMISSVVAERFEAFEKSDADRKAFIADIAKQLEELQINYGEIADDLSNEREGRRLWQTKARTYEQTLAEHKQTSASNSFALCILDGDGAIFQDYYLWNMGKEGGAEAAHRLNSELRANLKATYPEAIVADWKIVVQVVLNLEGLAKTLQSCGMVSNPNEVFAFGRAFGLAQPLFSFIDVGAGKERADHKIRETLRLYLPNAQCKHVFFGPTHDNGYVTVLEEYKRDYASRLTLIETRPAEPGFRGLGLKMLQFPQVFRSKDLSSSRPAFNTSTISAPAPPARALSGVQMQPTSAAFVPKSPSPSPSTDSLASSSWATVGKTTGGAKNINIAPKKAASRRYMLFSKEDERIDEDLPKTDYMAEKRFDQRVKNVGKCCNDYHLRGECPIGTKCQYVHGERLSSGEMLVLKHKARSLTCNYGTECDDINCPLGHHCKFGRTCGSENCRFADTHYLDIRPAKKVYEDGTEEWLSSFLNGH